MQVGIIGVGVMGSALATRLLEVGAQVALYDREPGRCAAFAAQGARVAGSACDAAVGSSFVITSLNSADIVEQVVFGPDGIAEAGEPRALLVDMSSIDPGRTAQLAARLLAQTGMGWVDAPLSGGAPAALRGRLTLMCGGQPDHFTRAVPLLSELSGNFTHFGPPGAGQTVKLINQILCAGQFLLLAESVRFAELHGVDATRIPAALAGGRADSRLMQEFMAKLAIRDYTPTGRIDNMLKDLETVQAAAFGRRIPLPVTSLVADLHRMLVAGGHGGADSAEYMRLFDLGGGQRP
jgi:2-hydroxy-3-oxopropionate reductase